MAFNLFNPFSWMSQNDQPLVSPLVKQTMDQQLQNKGLIKGVDGVYRKPDQNPFNFLSNPFRDILGATAHAQDIPLEKKYSPLINHADVPQNARANVTTMLHALDDAGILTPGTAAYALATTKHETAGSFQPVREGFYNDQKYGYQPGFTGQSIAQKNGYSGGSNYYGRGYIQLTHDYNYKNIGNQIGMGDQLVQNPDLALDPDTAAKVMAAYFKTRGTSDLASQGKFYDARGTINGDDNAAPIAQDAERYYSSLGGQP